MPRHIRLHRALATPLLLVALIGGAVAGATVAHAQATPPAAEVDPLVQMRDDLLARRYAEVLRRGNDLLGSSRRFTPAEQVRLWELMAAAYYPSDPAAQQPDSARLPLAALLRLSPDARLSRELTWPGLDSLLDVERGSDFRIDLDGPTSRESTLAEPAWLTVSSTRDVRFQLVTRSVATGRTVVHDSAGPARTARLRIRAHDGIAPILATGEYELRVVAIDPRTGDSTVARRRLRARANTSGTSAPIPPFIPPARVRGGSLRPGTAIAGGILFAGATVAMANGARAPEPIRSAFSADSRAMLVAGAMLGGVVAGLFIDRRRERPPSEREIADARAAYERRVAELREEAQARAVRYRVSLAIEEPRP